jgi:general secretion pathway protein H
MRTSPPSGADVRSRNEAGLTLVEILVVLAIIGVMSSVAVIGLGGAGQGASAKAEARRLAASIQLAADEALVADRPLALQWDAEGYSFVRWEPRRREWQPHNGQFGGRHDLPDEMSLASESDALPFRLDEGAGQGSLALTLTAGSQIWRVEFDGLTAATAPAIGG